MTELPKNWAFSTLGEVAKWGSGGTPKATRTDFYQGDIPWAVIGDLDDGVITDTEKHITETAIKESSAKLVPVGAILIAMYGSIGKLGVAGVEMTTNQAIAFAIPEVNILLPKFLFWFLAGQRDSFLKSGKGMTQQNISQTILKAWPIPVPPLDVQQRIIETLEDHLSRLDKANADIQKSRELLLSARRALLQSAFMGEIFLRSIAKSESGLPASWALKLIGEVAIVQGGVTPKGLTNVASAHRSESTPIPFFKVAEMNLDSRYLAESRTYISEADALQLKVTILPEGSLVFPKAGGAIATNKKRIIRVEGGIDTNCMALTAREELLGDYLYWFFESFNLMDLSNGSILPQISKKSVDSLPIPIPTLEVQKRIVETLEDHLSRLDKTSQALDIVEREAQELRRSLLQAAFTGQLTKGESND